MTDTETEVSFIGFIENWQQAVTWLVLLVVLYSIVSGKLRYDLTAYGGLLLLGILGLRTPAEIFSGFSSPVLFTIVTVLVMSAGIVESGLLNGLGKKIASKIHSYQNQIMAIFLSAGFISAFINNVGVIGIALPTAKRMAQRAGVPHSAFGIPLIYASILGGSITLIGTASNLIVSSYRSNAFGEPFNLFDFSAHGLAMLFSGSIVLFLCRICGLRLAKKDGPNQSNRDRAHEIPTENVAPRNRKKSVIVLITLLPIIILTGIGLIHPSLAFGIVTLTWIFSGVLPYKTALSAINIPLIIFLGSMFGISDILEETGAFTAVVRYISPLFTALPPFLMILIFLFIAVVFANVLDSSVAVVLMAPIAVALWRSGAVPFNPDALLMAIAAGASLGLVIPADQTAIVVMNSMEFPRKTFVTLGAVIAIAAGIFSSLVIYALWR